MMVGVIGLTGCDDDDTVTCPENAPLGPDFCPDGRVELVDDGDACPTYTCVPTDCPVYDRPQCPEGQHVETVTDEAGCNVPRCAPGICPQVAAPPADFCPNGERVEQFVNAAGCTDLRCALVNCPIYNRPLCGPGEHLEIVVNEEGCDEPVCVADVDPCPAIAAPDATFCPGGQVLLDEGRCQWVCHGGDRCPFIGDFAECQGTTVVEAVPATRCLRGIECLP